MKIGFLGKEGQLSPLYGKLERYESRKGTTDVLVPKGVESSHGIRIHNDNPPRMHRDGDSVQVSQGHVYIGGRNFLLLSEDERGDSTTVFFGFRLRLPERDLIRGHRPVEVYSPDWRLLTKRIFCDNSKVVAYDDGKFSTLTGFSMLRDGESCRLISQPLNLGAGCWRIYNDGGNLNPHWTPTTIFGH
jgi:hypothetical protein